MSGVLAKWGILGLENARGVLSSATLVPHRYRRFPGRFSLNQCRRATIPTCRAETTENETDAPAAHVPKTTKRDACGPVDLFPIGKTTLKRTPKTVKKAKTPKAPGTRRRSLLSGLGSEGFNAVNPDQMISVFRSKRSTFATLTSSISKTAPM